MADKRFGIEFVVTDKGISTLDKAGKEVDQLGDSMEEASKQIAKFEKASSNATLQAKSLARAKRAARKPTTSLTKANKGLAASHTDVQDTASGLRDTLGELKNRGTDPLTQSIGGAAEAVGALTQGLDGPEGLIIGIGLTSIKVKELIDVAGEWRLEMMRGEEAAARVHEETEKQTEQYKEIAAAVGVTEEELRGLHKSFADLLTHANENPEGRIAQAFGDMADAAVDARIGLEATSEAVRKNAETFEQNRAAQEAMNKVAEEVRNRLGIVEESVDGTTEAFDRMSEVAPDALEETADGLTAVERRAERLQEAMAAITAQNDLFAENTTEVTRRAVENFEQMQAAISGIQAQIGIGTGEQTTASGQTIEGVLGQLQNIRGGSSRLEQSFIDSFMEQVESGDIGGARQIADSAQGQADVIRNLGGISGQGLGAGKDFADLAQTLRDMIRQLQASGNRPIVVEASVDIDGAEVARAVSDTIARGGFGLG